MNTPSPITKQGVARAPLGARVGTFDERGVPQVPESASLRREVACSRLLLFDGPLLSDRALLDLAAQFGTVCPPPAAQARGDLSAVCLLRDEDDEVATVANWHVDASYAREPPHIGILQCVRAPVIGGETAWACMYGALEALPDSLRRRLAGLEALHDFFVANGSLLQRRVSSECYARLRRVLPPVRHPVVLRHPETNRDVLFVNRTFTTEIVGMPPREGQQLLGRLFRHVDECRDCHRTCCWTAGMVAVWDNWATQHAKASVHWPRTRVLKRVLIK